MAKPDKTQDENAHVRYVRYLEDRTGERFDRVQYAAEMLRLLAPKGLTVAVRQARGELRALTVTDWSQDPSKGARQSVLAIPEHATRQDIALAVAALAGVEDQVLTMALLQHMPWRD